MAPEGRGLRNGPSRRPPLKFQDGLPSTPESSPPRPTASNAQSPCIWLRGEPLNSPAKVHFGLIADDNDINAPADTKSSKKTRKNSFQRAVDVNKETLGNTKKNSGYSSVDIVKEIVRVDGPRPPSPSPHFVKDSKKPDLVDAMKDEEITNAPKGVKFRQEESGGDIQINEPPFYDTFYPLKSILKTSRTEDLTEESNAACKETKEKVVVKKVVYADESEPRIISAGPSPQPPKASSRIYGPARRVVR